MLSSPDISATVRCAASFEPQFKMGCGASHFVEESNGWDFRDPCSPNRPSVSRVLTAIRTFVRCEQPRRDNWFGEATLEIVQLHERCLCPPVLTRAPLPIRAHFCSPSP